LIQLYEGNGAHDETNVPINSQHPYTFAMSNRAQETTSLELSQPNGQKTTSMQTKIPTMK
jgi:hypothetical protein